MMNDPSLHVANTALHVISTISSAIMSILLLCVRCMNGNRSFWHDYTIVFYILLVTSWSYCVNSLMFLIHDYTPLPCSVSNFFQLWLSNQSAMLSSAFAMFMLRRLKFAVLYWTIPCFLSLVLALVSSLGFYTLGSDSQCSWYDNVNQAGSLLMYLIPQLLCTLFNISVLCYIFVARPSSVPASYILYPLLPFVSQLGPIVNQISLYMTKTQDSSIGWWAFISNGLEGLVLLMIFLADPFFWQGMNIAKGAFLWTPRRHIPTDEATFTTNDTSSDNDITKATTKPNSTASSMTTQTGTLTMPDPVVRSNRGLIAPMKEKEDNTEKDTNVIKQQHLPFYQPSLSPHRRDAPIIIFPPPPPIAPSSNIYKQQQERQHQHPTSLELDESDFIGMFSKPVSLHVDTALSTTCDSTSTGLVSPPSPALLLPVCYEMEDAVPWRVLEADEEEEEDDYQHRCDEEYSIHTNYQQKNRDSASAIGQFHSEGGATSKQIHSSNNNNPPRHSSLSVSTSGYRKESWLSLYDDDGNEAMDTAMYGGHYDEEKADPHHSFTSSSAPSTVSEWLTRRGDSFDGMREQMGRTSKSIRRWCRNVNRQQQQDDIPSDSTDRYDDGPRPILHVVHEEQSQ